LASWLLSEASWFLPIYKLWLIPWFCPVAVSIRNRASTQILNSCGGVMLGCATLGLYQTWWLHTRTWKERHENVEECSPSARPSPASPTAAPSASHACRAMRGVQIPVLRRHRGWRPRAVITTLRPKGTFMNAGSAVPLASVTQARSIHQWTAIWTCCQFTLLQTSHPKLVPKRADVSSQNNKLLIQARNDSSVDSRVSLHPIPNSFLPRKASLVRMRSWINCIRPILIQWLPAMLRCVVAPRLNYAWTRVCPIESECLSPKVSIKPWVSANIDKPTHTSIYM